MSGKYGTKEWFESQFSDLDDFGDKWGPRWRGSQKFRHDLNLKIIEKTITTKKNQKILDIGCGLGEFTERLYDLNKSNNEYFDLLLFPFHPLYTFGLYSDVFGGFSKSSNVIGTDISENAISKISKNKNIKYKVDYLPEIGFPDNYFDVITALEVICYLSEEQRIESFKNISKKLKTDGYLLFSGVLDDGITYFTEDEIVELISKYFEIEERRYNYARIYTSIETKFLFLLTNCEIVKSVLNMSDEDFSKWCGERKDKKKTEVVKKFRMFVNKITFGRRIIKIIDNLVISIIRMILSWEIPVNLSYKLTKLILREKGKRHIFILARNSNRGEAYD